MTGDDLDFSFDVTGIDRSSLLVEAAGLVDLRRTVLGAQRGPEGETEEGRLIRGLIDDIAALPAFPDVYRITDDSFLSAGFAHVPAHFTQIAKDFKFYWIEVPIGLFPRLGWAYNRLELRVDFNKTERRPTHLAKVRQLLPAPKFEEQLRAGASLSLGINEEFEFTAGLRTPAMAPMLVSAASDGHVGAEINAKLGLAGRFVYHIKKAKIYTTSPGLHWAMWRLDGSEFFQEDAPHFIVILQIPRALRDINVDAELRAYRYFQFLTASFQEAISTLPEIMRTFFKGGVPVADRLESPWHIEAR